MIFDRGGEMSEMRTDDNRDYGDRNKLERGKRFGSHVNFSALAEPVALQRLQDDHESSKGRSKRGRASTISIYCQIRCQRWSEERQRGEYSTISSFKFVNGDLLVGRLNTKRLK